MALPDPLQGESLLQYALRMGMAPNEASAMLAQTMQSNPSAPTNYRGAVQGAVDRRAGATKDWFGNRLNDPSSPYYMPPITLNPQTTGQGWVGQQWVDLATGKPVPPGTPGSVPGGGGTAPGGGGTAPGGGGGGGPFVPPPVGDPQLPPGGLPTLPVTPGAATSVAVSVWVPAVLRTIPAKMCAPESPATKV